MHGGSPISGTITGNSVLGSVVFVREIDGQPQVYIGSYAALYGTNVELMMTGVFYHVGLGPYPWVVFGSIVG
jgi:hypothetical protein